MLEQQIVWKDESNGDESLVVLIKNNTSLGACYDFACKFRAYVLQRMIEEQKASEQAPQVQQEPGAVQPEVNEVQPVKGAD